MTRNGIDRRGSARLAEPAAVIRYQGRMTVECFSGSLLRAGYWHVRLLDSGSLHDPGPPSRQLHSIRLTRTLLN